MIKTLLWLILAAMMEVGGDALVRMGVRHGKIWGFLLGALTLFAYGLFVNLPKWDFGRLLGVYIAVFFLVAQLTAYLFFKERPTWPIVVGGLLIVTGGVMITLGSGK